VAAEWYLHACARQCGCYVRALAIDIDNEIKPQILCGSSRRLPSAAIVNNRIKKERKKERERYGDRLRVWEEVLFFSAGTRSRASSAHARPDRTGKYMTYEAEGTRVPDILYLYVETVVNNPVTGRLARACVFTTTEKQKRFKRR